LSQWTRQFGTAADDLALDIAAADGLYVLGLTAGTFPGQVSAGASDLFLRRADGSGAEVWTRQFGSSATNFPWGVAAGPGGVVVAGSTSGSLPGLTNSGGFDAFVRYYDPAGKDLFTRAVATTASDEGLAVARNASAAILVGSTSGVLPGQSSAGSSDAFWARLALPSPLTPEPPAQAVEALEELRRQITDLAKDGGALNQGQARSLLAKVDQIRKSMLSGQLRVACNVTGALRQEMAALAGAGILPEAQVTEWNGLLSILDARNACAPKRG
jgi:hypothetical protein